jgi:uncharacterized membrane protein
VSARRTGGETGAVARRLAQNVASSLLALPAAFAVLAVLLAAVLLAIEPEYDPEVGSFLFPGSADSARAILGAVTASTITLAGLVFSITMLVLQLASSQYSPRTLRTFLADRNSHFTLAVFVGTFTYSVVVLRSIGPEGEDAVPGVAVTASLVFMLVTIGVFVQYIAHITKQIRVASIMTSIAQGTTKAIARCRARAGAEPNGGHDRRPMRTVTAEGSGYVVLIDIKALVRIATPPDAFIEVVPRIGDFVVSGAPLLRVDGVAESSDNRLRRAVRLAPERELALDIQFGLRQLVDIAVRALSPSLNDPTTAIESLNHLHELLRNLAAAELATGRHCDDEGTFRVQEPVASWGDHFSMVFDPILDHARHDREVTATLSAICRDLVGGAAGPDRRLVLATLSRVDQALRDLLADRNQEALLLGPP